MNVAIKNNPAWNNLIPIQNRVGAKIFSYIAKNNVANKQKIKQNLIPEVIILKIDLLKCLISFINFFIKCTSHKLSI